MTMTIKIKTMMKDC